MDAGMTADRRDELARKAVILAEASHRINLALKEAKRLLEDEKLMSPGDTRRLTVESVTGQIPAGTVSFTLGSQSVIVTDKDALIGWLDTHYPGAVQIVTTEDVDPIVWKQFRVLNGQATGPAGELDIPGIDVHTSTGHVTVIKPKGTAADLLWAQLVDDAAGVLALPEGGTDDE